MTNEMIKKQMSLGGLKIPYAVQRNPRSFKIWIRVEDEEGLVIVLPKGRKAAVVPKVIREHKDWVLSTLEKREERMKNAHPPLGTTRSLIYRGRKVDLKVKNVACPDPHVSLKNNAIRVIMPKNSDKSVSEVLSGWMRERALLLFSRRVEYFAGKLGLRFGSIYIRDQKTRWGSCSSNGSLSFNWRLLLAPPEVLDYVVVHEVSHLKYHDHSNRFWALVKSLFPSHEKSRLWLKENGLILKT